MFHRYQDYQKKILFVDFRDNVMSKNRTHLYHNLNDRTSNNSTSNGSRFENNSSALSSPLCAAASMSDWEKPNSGTRNRADKHDFQRDTDHRDCHLVDM